MYAMPTEHAIARRWRLADTAVWRARGAVVAVLAVALFALAFVKEAASSPVVTGPVPVAAKTVTVAPGDTLWDIASRRYPGADVREKVFEIERLNGLSGPAIEAGQHLRVPAR